MGGRVGRVKGRGKEGEREGERDREKEGGRMREGGRKGESREERINTDRNHLNFQTLISCKSLVFMSSSFSCLFIQKSTLPARFW